MFEGGTVHLLYHVDLFKPKAASPAHNHRVQQDQLLKLGLSTLPVAVARSSSSSDDVAIRYVLPVLWMTSRLPTTLTASPGPKCGVYD